MNIQNWKRIVIKVGSALIAPNKKGCSSHYLLSIAQFIVRCRERGIEVVLVSSGSIAAGAHLFEGVSKKNVAIKKAMAAAGQTEMMATWDKLFDFATAQILLTNADLYDRNRYTSVRETLFSLLEHGLLPIVNENDTIVTDKHKVGDNDNLSATIAAAADADALIICSDIDGLYTENPHTNPDAQMIKEIPVITEEIRKMAGESTSDVGTGGMITKIQAAQKATSHGITTFIVNGFTEQSFNALLNGENPGSVFLADENPLKEKEHWRKHTVVSRGEVVVKDEASEQLSANPGDLHADEILEVNGEFSVGDTVTILTDDGTKIAKAEVNYSSCLLNYIAEQDVESDEMVNSILSEDNIAMLNK